MLTPLMFALALAACPPAIGAFNVDCGSAAAFSVAPSYVQRFRVNVPIDVEVRSQPVVLQTAYVQTFAAPVFVQPFAVHSFDYGCGSRSSRGVSVNVEVGGFGRSRSGFDFNFDRSRGVSTFPAEGRGRGRSREVVKEKVKDKIVERRR